MITTGPDFRATHVLSDGTTVLLRHVRPSDAPEIRRAFETLSPTSRYRRFFGAVSTLSDAMLSYLTEVDGNDHVAIVAMHESPDLKSESGVGVARFIRIQGEPEVAEAAVTVVDGMQRRGLGRVLSTTLAEAARERGIRRFRAEVLASNEPMRKMLEDAHALVVREEPGATTFDVVLDPDGSAPPREPPLLRMLRAVASSMAGLVRALGMPPRG